MRRFVVTLMFPLLAVGLLAGCGGSPAQSSTASSVTVSGAFGNNPAIKIPAQKASKALTVKTIIHGTGPVLGKTDAFIGNYAIYIWSGTAHRLAQSSFTQHEPTLFAGQLLPGLEKALVGQKMGSRVLAVIPPKDAFGSSGNAQVGIKGTDTLVFVVDLIKSFKGNASATGQQLSSGGGALPKVTATTGAAPKIKVPSSKPPAKLVTKVLVKGSGPAVKANQTVVVQYVGALWRSGKGNGTVFDASWKRGQRPDRPDRRQPGNAGHPARRWLRQGRQHTGGDQAHRHPRVRGGRAGRLLIPELERLVDGLAGQEGGQQLGQAARVEALAAAQDVADLPPPEVWPSVRMAGRCPGTRALTTISCCSRRTPRERQVVSRRQDGGPMVAGSSSSPVSSRTSRTAASR
jgi:peptidylprolyl isomerase